MIPIILSRYVKAFRYMAKDERHAEVDNVFLDRAVIKERPFEIEITSSSPQRGGPCRLAESNHFIGVLAVIQAGEKRLETRGDL